jgi:lysophospholipase L1-like esterase
MNRSLPALLALGSFLVASPARAGHANVACVGDSITAGVGAGRGWAYPSQLQRMLGPDYTVRNFGVSGATLLRHGDRPYEVQRAFKGALDFKPDIVVLMLGTNDTKPQNWGPHSAEFEGDYRWLVGQLQGTNPAQKLFVCRPCWVAGAGNYGINEPILEKEIPIIDSIAASMHLGEIDMHAALEGHPEDLADRVHPNNDGATLMAKAAYKAITGNEFQGQVPAPAPKPSPAPMRTGT